LRDLYQQESARLLGVAKRIARDNALAEDIVHDVYIRIWYVLGTLPAEQRIEVQRRLAEDDDLRAAVDAWEQRLFALNELAEPWNPTRSLN
jgi:anti-sigma-K factor RskA